MGTKNSQLPHWLIVSVEKDSHGNQDITAVSLAESTEVCSEAGPLQEGLEDKRGTGMRAVAGTRSRRRQKGLTHASLHVSLRLAAREKEVPGTCSVLCAGRQFVEWGEHRLWGLIELV